MRSSKSVRGFTLVELLVVITIIGILISLLLPAVQAAREAARRAECVNHLKQLSLGCLNHESAIKTFPTGGWGFTFLGHPDLGQNWSQPGGWMFNILPYIEQGQLYNNQLGKTGTTLATAAKALLATPLASFYCPTRRGAKLYPLWATHTWDSGAISALATMGLTGDQQIIYDTGTTTARTTITLAQAPRNDYAANGYTWMDLMTNASACVPLGTALTAATTLGPYGAQAILADMANVRQVQAQLATQLSGQGGVITALSTVAMNDIQDGSSNTFLCGEKWMNPDDYYTGTEHGDQWHPYVGGDPEVLRFVGPAGGSYNKVLPDRQGLGETGIFGSAHAGSLNMAFCDGSVHQISYGISLSILNLLGHRADHQALDATGI